MNRGRPDTAREFPWWLVAALGLGLWLLWGMLTDPAYAGVLPLLGQGISITLMVALVAFAGASALGLALALAQLSRWRLLRQLARFYVEITRGIPIIVLLLYVAFVLAPALVELWNQLAGRLGLPELRPRDFPMLWRAVLALTLAYAAFLAEVFRAGINAVPQGEIEAAEALGLSRRQCLRRIILPQAFRTILPPWGNDFVAMVKDSSLVSVLGVADVTQLGKVLAAGNFRYFETYNAVALIYLTLTISLSLALRRFERHLRRGQR